LINALCVCNVERKMDFLSDLLNQNGVGSSADLEWDETQFASPQEDQMVVEEAVVEVEASPVLKGNKKRTRNFSVQEDNLLVAAWLELALMQFEALTSLVPPIGKEFMTTIICTRNLIVTATAILSLTVGVLS